MRRWSYLLLFLVCAFLLERLIYRVRMPIYNKLQKRTNYPTLIHEELNAKLEERTVNICRPAPEPVVATTRFALVSMLSSSNAWTVDVYANAAAKLGTSFRMFSAMDMIIIAVDQGATAPVIIQETGWMWCDVPRIHAPTNAPKHN
jgi:hypothetical protein